MADRLDEISGTVEDQALAWFVRLRSGDATEGDRTRFKAWLGASAEHRTQYQRLANIWTDLDGLPDPRKAPVTECRRIPRRRFLAAGAAFGGLAVAAGVATWPTLWSGDFRSGTGERRVVTAPDGSQIELDAASSVSVDFTGERRRLHLLQGRAMFTVARDPKRPFEVACETGVTRALGTVFVIHRRATDVAVSVQESAVMVSMVTDHAPGDAVQVSAGESLIYQSGGLGPVRRIDVEAEMSWRRGKLLFRDRPLGDVVADLNRYRPGQIVIWDSELQNLRVDGIFDMANADAALEAIVSTLPVRATRLSRYLVLLRRT